MPLLHQRQLSDVSASLAQIEPLDAALYGKVDTHLLVGSLGFEPRCLSVVAKLAAAGHRCGRAVIVEYATNRADNEANWPALSEKLLALGSSVERLPEESTDYVGVLKAAVAEIRQKTASCPRVILDISVMANRLILPVAKTLLEEDVDLTVVYAEAATYYPTQGEYESNRDAWCAEDQLGLERGVGGVEFSREYPGLHLDPLPDCILLFPSFRGERGRAIISLVDPALPSAPGDRVIWLLGEPHLPQDRWRLEAMRAMNSVPESAPTYPIGTFNYKEALEIVHKVASERGTNSNVTVAPVGSKMQALGTVFACYCHPELRAIVSKPREYNASHFSDGCKALWQIRFGETAAVRRQLLSAGELFVPEATASI